MKVFCNVLKEFIYFPLILFIIFCLLPLATPDKVFASLTLFDYKEVRQSDIKYLSQWVSVLERHITDDVPEGNCTESFFNRCHLKEWFSFLESIKNLPPQKQINAVNRYANKKSYVLDIANYGMEDYWAIVKEFLYNGGDCEDYAITKFFSLKWLGVSPDIFRIVILQDTNLRIPHAVLAVSINNDILIMDNQSQEVLSHKQIVHYVPLFSVDEKNWWLHFPKM